MVYHVYRVMNITIIITITITTKHSDTHSDGQSAILFCEDTTDVIVIPRNSDHNCYDDNVKLILLFTAKIDLVLPFC